MTKNLCVFSDILKPPQKPDPNPDSHPDPDSNPNSNPKANPAPNITVVGFEGGVEVKARVVANRKLYYVQGRVPP